MTGLVDGKVALVTGAASGIGRATALAFAREGAAVAVTDLSPTGAQAAVDEIVREGGTAFAAACDVTDAEQVERAVTETVERLGGLHCACNNAGYEVGTMTTTELSEEDLDRTLAVNLKGPWLCMKYEIPAMLDVGGGAIVNIGSALALVGLQGFAAYTASKHGCAGLTKAVALEYARRGVRVNMVCPGSTDTPMTRRDMANDPEFADAVAAAHPIGRIARPAEIAEAVVWHCSDRASFVTGAIATVDGGLVAQ